MHRRLEFCGSVHGLWHFWEGELAEGRRNLVCGRSELSIHVGAVAEMQRV